MNIGKLEQVDLREIWKHEASDFTQWLSQPENLEFLGDEINLTLVEPIVSHNVGKFYCDIVCKDGHTDKTVIIENQLEQTDHDHLGKIITYASGTNASYIIWIVKTARDEHKSAIEWLNNQTISDIGFFLIEIRAFRIGNSDAAPQFHVVEQPNDWSKEIKKTVSNGELNRSETLRLAFWENLNYVIEQRKDSGLKTRKANKDHWYNFPFGSSLCQISVDLVDKEGFIRVHVWIYDCKELYDFLHACKTDIENKMQNIDLTWDRKDNRKGANIAATINGLNLDDDSTYEQHAHKIIDLSSKFKSVFEPIIKKFKQQ